MWIELTEPIDINGAPRQPGYRVDYPRTAAVELISRGRARGVSGPHEGRTGAGYPIEESSDEPETPDEGPESSTSVESIDWTSVDGIGPSTAEEIEQSLDSTFPDVETVEQLLEANLTELDGIGPSMADELADYLETLL